MRKKSDRCMKHLLPYSSSSSPRLWGISKNVRQKLMTLLCLLTASVGLTGCGASRVVFVDESEGFIRMGPDVKGRVYYWNGSSWELSDNKVLIPEGWYAGSIDGDVEGSNDTRPAAVDN